MKRGSQIRAFTMIELIVVMLLTSILVTALWGSFGVIYKYFKSRSKKNSQAEQLLFFHNQLNEDFDRCKWVRQSAGDIICILADHEIKYHMNSSSIIRMQHQRKDTLAAEQLHYITIGMDVSHPEIIKGLELNFLSDQHPMRFVIHKQYDAETRLKLEIQ